MKKALITAGAAFAILSLATADACAVWMTNGTPVCMAGGDQFRPMIIPDGGRGAFMSWLDQRSGNWDIYVQHFDENGEALWAINGAAVCTASGDQGRAELIRDDSGGIIVAWFDGRGSDSDIYAQRIDANGYPLWTADGIALCSASGDQLEPRIASDGAGGAIVSWEDHRGAGGVYAQRVDADGTVRWEADGVAISDAGGVSSWPSLAPDGAGGAIIAWFDSRTGDDDIYAQRVDASGSVLWTVNGVTVCGAAGDQTSANNFFIVPDGAGGGIIAWDDGRAGNGDIYAQRIDADGDPLWTADGVALCSSAGDQMGPGITSDGAGGAIVAWQDGRAYDYDIYAQRVDSSGTARWTPDGVALCVYVYDQTGPKVATDGSGGAVVTWRDARINDGTTDIFAQRIDADGLVRWSDQGEPVCFTWYTQALGFIAPDEVGGAIVVWHDYRNQSHYDIFAYRIYPDPTFEGEPRPLILAVDDVPNDEGGKLSIPWENSGLDVYPSLEIESYSVWRRLPKPVP
ncbi:MAG: hypothetical protein PHQ19_02000, partial [Candidatus Krumholzibacteria bacterium]|nr:hypothetical protein [Candidatus Krumholzibacteria bacterium]